MMIEGFYYHAWAEVWLSDPAGQGRWVAVDPTFNQVPADATHLRLVEGDFERMLNVMQVMGKLRVEVVEYQ
jgi:transglutaminase-like putative cysteine protease